METTNSKLPRGIRNNNPLNIRKSKIQWMGLANKQTDPSFCVFMSMEWGVRAACKIIQTYILRHKINTVRGIIHRWAPPSDGNDTGAYVRAVCKGSGMFPETCIDANDSNALERLLFQMAKVECGYEVPANTIRRGVRLAFYGMCD